MSQIHLSAEIRNHIMIKVNSMNIHDFIKNEVAKTTEKINYYKISNLHSNIDEFVSYLESLNKSFTKEIRISLCLKSLVDVKTILENPKDEHKSRIEKAKLHANTSLVLTIAEFVNSPLRIKNKFKLYSKSALKSFQ